MTSGARYHRVATYSVMKVLLSSTLGGGRAERARPKSQSCGMVRRENGGLEMTHLEIAVGIEKKIRWLEIAMKYVCRVKRLERPERLHAVSMDYTGQAEYIPGI